MKTHAPLTANLTNTPPATFYCHCPKFHAGPLCEVKYETCPGPGNSTKCSNGTPCAHDVNNDGELYWRCECNRHGTDYSSMYARRACSHAGTVFCTPPSEHKKKQIQQSLGKAAGSYCMNGGKCKDDQKKGSSYHAGCTCTDEFKGSHCETPATKSLADKLHYYDKDEESTDEAAVKAAETEANKTFQEQVNISKRRRKRFAWMCALVALTAFGMVGFSVWDGVRDGRRRRRRRLERATRIPTEVGVSKKKKSKKKNKKKSRQAFEPLEIEDPEGHGAGIHGYHD